MLIVGGSFPCKSRLVYIRIDEKTEGKQAELEELMNDREGSSRNFQKCILPYHCRDRLLNIWTGQEEIQKLIEVEFPHPLSGLVGECSTG